MTWHVWRVAPFITSFFFVLGVFTLHQVIFNWLKKLFKDKNIRYSQNLLNAFLGIIYMAVLSFGIQSNTIGSTYVWEFLNFIIIGLVYCSYFLNIRLPYYYFVPIVLIYMIWNQSIFYWQSWLQAICVMLSYWSFQKIRRLSQDSHPFFNYLLSGAFWGAILWLFDMIKFSLTLTTFLEQWSYLVIFELLLYAYVRMVLRQGNITNHLVELANIDALTQTNNFAAYEANIQDDFTFSHENSVPLSMMMFDIDRFKSINDTYGHLVGDTILKDAVDTTQTILKANDSKIKLFRTGGEEFNIIFENYDLNSTKDVVGQIFTGLNNKEINIGNNRKVKISISVGVSQLLASDQNAQAFYKRVDNNLYYSKKHGRMRITSK